MTKQLRFSKMHGLGNDFVLVNGINQTIPLSTSFIKKISDRHCGIGFDQLLVIEKSELADFACRIFNADGSEAEQCGNGMRCIGRFILEENLSQNKLLRIETKTRIITITITDNDHIEVNMGQPQFDPQNIPFVAKNFQVYYPISIKDIGDVNITVLSMGNPHAILFVPSLEKYPVNHVGAFIANHALFPQGVNVGFVELLDRHHIRLRTYERGVGETLACGSNACAAVITGILTHQLENIVEVELSLGRLNIQWEGHGHCVFMRGPASHVFTGFITI